MTLPLNEVYHALTGGFLDALAAPVWYTSIVCALFLGVIAANGAKHGHIWARGGWRHRPPIFRRLTVHFVDGLQEPAIWFLAYLTGANPIAILGAGMISRPVFEGLINTAAGRAWHDDGQEPDDFEIRWLGYSRPKLEGQSVYAAFALGGAALFLFHPWISEGLLALLT
jgi:hypothetical protein